MPKMQVVFYQETPRKSPVMDWLSETEKNHSGSSNKLRACIERLATWGHELRRPTADFLRDGIYELRGNYQSRAYRLLYFFHKQRAVLCHAILKRDDHKKEFEKAIDKAIKRKDLYIQDPDKYTYGAETVRK